MSFLTLGLLQQYLSLQLEEEETLKCPCDRWSLC